MGVGRADAGLLLGTGMFLTLAWVSHLEAFGIRVSIAARGFKERVRRHSAFRALMTSLSATIGTGNIAGVATAITLGGRGSVLDVADCIIRYGNKYAGGTGSALSEQDDQGGYSGGPMYYIRNGLGPRYALLGSAFALLGHGRLRAGQYGSINSVAQVLGDQFHIHWALVASF